MSRALFLCILLCSSCSVSTGGGLEPNPANAESERKVISSSNRAFLPLARRRGPGSPAQTKHEPCLAETLRRDEARRNHIIVRSVRHMAVGSPDNGVVVPAELGYSVDSLEYVVTVGFATPTVPQTVIVDSGSNFAWIQCKPCGSDECYPQKDPLFDPRKSSAYAPFPCDSGACRNISYNEGNRCTGEKLCGFALSYGDGSNSTGVYSSDKLTLAPGVAVEGFRFGCGHGQGGWNDMSTGLIGLGNSPESLVSQASPSYGGTFSYCLPPTGSSAGFLALGRPSDTSGFAFTPMHPSGHYAVFYKVTLTGISVAGMPLDVPPSAFPHGDYGMILDSGTVITALPAAPYAALRAAFRRAMAAYPPAPPIHPVDTCYNLTGYANVTVPGVALTFLGGSTVELDNPSGILVEGCLAFRGFWLRPGHHGNGVIGNVNQRAFEVLYDPEQLRVGFRARAC